MSAQPDLTNETFAPAFAELLEGMHPLATARTAVSPSGQLSAAACDLWNRLGSDGWLGIWEADSRVALAPELLAFAEVAGRQALTLPFSFPALLLPLLHEQAELDTFDWGNKAEDVVVGRVHPVKEESPVLFDFFGPNSHYFDIAISSQSCQVRRIEINSSDVVPGLDACVPVAAVPAESVQTLAIKKFPIDLARLCTLLKPYMLFEYGQMVGAANAALDIAIAYARERRQFGRAIGEFQAVKHALADAWVAVDNGRYALRALMATSDADAAMPLLISRCDRMVSESCRRAARLAIQVHGGIGFAWEHDAHIYLKRIYTLAARLRPLAHTLGAA
ncbi:hypothetical protein KXJ72_16175 [Comamonas aquatica]|nr:hypothetical protein KXJ72_16175 [Comamonas aquatica]